MKCQSVHNNTRITKLHNTLINVKICENYVNIINFVVVVSFGIICNCNLENYFSSFNS